MQDRGIRIKTYYMHRSKLEAICETMVAMGMSYSLTKPSGRSEGFQDQHFMMIHIKTDDNKRDAIGYLQLVGVPYEVVDVTVPEKAETHDEHSAYAMVSVRHVDLDGVEHITDFLRKYGINHAVIEELMPNESTIDIFCEDVAALARVGLFFSTAGREITVTYAEGAMKRPAVIPNAKDADDETPVFVELGPVQSILLYRAYYAEESRKRHAKEEWFSQTDRDIQNRELWRGKAIEAGVPEAQADRYIYAGELDFQGAGY